MSESLYDEANNVDRGLNPDGTDPDHPPPVSPQQWDEVVQTLREIERGDFPTVERCRIEARYLLNLIEGATPGVR